MNVCTCTTQQYPVAALDFNSLTEVAIKTSIDPDLLERDIMLWPVVATTCIPLLYLMYAVCHHLQYHIYYLMLCNHVHYQYCLLCSMPPHAVHCNLCCVPPLVVLLLSAMLCSIFS